MINILTTANSLWKTALSSQWFTNTYHAQAQRKWAKQVLESNFFHPKLKAHITRTKQTEYVNTRYISYDTKSTVKESQSTQPVSIYRMFTPVYKNLLNANTLTKADLENYWDFF